MVTEVNKNIIRGPRPKNLESLVAMGIKNIINLESGFYEIFNDDYYEVQFPCDFGINEFNIPMSDFSAPTEQQVSEAINILRRDKKT